VEEAVVLASAMPGDRENVPQSGMDGYVAKPLCNDELFAEIARLRSRVSESKVLT
jgi:CheY-like chemotaxis protein